MDNLKMIEKALREHSEILFAYLYGSVARGENRKGSDIDIGIYVKNDLGKKYDYASKIALEIEKKTGLKNVEIVALNDKSLRFLNQVLRYGKIIFSTDEKERIQFETTVTKEYIDFKPYYEEYDRMRQEA